ncbi:hypothetical protein CDAR_94561 [Caerostris darwini]|uniref:Uncharacterized protein n=1 Tax=Caerostris darwini TaxID=1538125 RepID=A0AAV4NF03_9ARAC|nr:hypothetical protein CDAR_94561 [Caerostris darwini]
MTSLKSKRKSEVQKISIHLSKGKSTNVDTASVIKIAGAKDDVSVVQGLNNEDLLPKVTKVSKMKSKPSAEATSKKNTDAESLDAISDRSGFETNKKRKAEKEPVSLDQPLRSKVKKASDDSRLLKNLKNTSTKPSHQKISEIADLGSVEVENGVEILNKEKLQDIKIKKKGKTKSKENGDQRLDENSDKKDENETKKFTINEAPAKKIKKDGSEYKPELKQNENAKVYRIKKSPETTSKDDKQINEMLTNIKREPESESKPKKNVGVLLENGKKRKNVKPLKSEIKQEIENKENTLTKLKNVARRSERIAMLPVVIYKI